MTDGMTDIPPFRHLGESRADVTSPYRGPEEFRFVDHEIFTQREQEIWEILQLITLYRGVVIYGNSGNGKSSLVNAGVVPEIINLGYTVDRVRVQPPPGGEFLVERISMGEEGTAPFVESGLFQGASKDKSKTLTVEQFAEALNDSAGQKRSLLVFDQFEEIVTRFKDSSSTADRECTATQQRILAELERLLHSELLPVKLLFVFREDYLAPVRHLLSKCPEVIRQYYWLRTPSVDKTQAIIEGPLRLPRFRGKLDGLTTEIAAQLNSRARSGSVNLTDLQIACLELWKSREPGALLDSKRVEGVIQDHLERTLEPLRESGLHQAAIVLLGTMVTPRGTRNVISEYDALAKVSPLVPVKDVKLREALNELVKTRLVRKFIEGEANYYEITSESLSEWINKKRALQELRMQQDKAKREVRRQSRSAVSALALGAVLVLWLGLYFYSKASFHATVQQLQSAQSEIQVLQKQKGDSDSVLRLLSSRLPLQKKGVATLFGSDTLEMAIGVAFLILLLGLVCSAVNELLAMYTKSRARTLRRGLWNLLIDERLLEAFYRHPLIKSLTQTDTPPEYIPSRTFAMALMDIVAPARLSRDDNETLTEIKFSLHDKLDSDLQRALLLMSSQSRSLNELYANIGNWFENVMDAVGAAYKKRTMKQLFVLSMLLAVAVNFDTLAVVSSLSSSSATRAALTAAAENYLRDDPAGSFHGTSGTAISGSFIESGAALADLEKRYSIPITWSGATIATLRSGGLSSILQKCLGWLITALAVAVCAAFWFDFLNRFMVVRSAIKPYQNLPLERVRSE